MVKKILGTKSKNPIDYTLENLSKITFEFLKSHLWSAAGILRVSLDSSEYHQPVMTLLFLKRLNDTFEENAENLINKGLNKKRPIRRDVIIFTFLKMLECQNRICKRKCCNPIDILVQSLIKKHSDIWIVIYDTDNSIVCRHLVSSVKLCVSYKNIAHQSISKSTNYHSYFLLNY